ncbi:hypothetical protein CHU95_03385 [Niveispirillum lacus]|uniref:Uncharacterized protein n=1 Tax=Niveispirillum lacus TaxID=1981099 RepID=A0A255Z7F6_9PROT|nr:hypothetical protein [Niveispirillum lacus]OYQ36825.1 hypothetical protein CHU95_03385 [Niveispirillum lacus]
MDLESMFCVDRDFDSLEMGGFRGIDRIVPRGGDATRFSDDVPIAWGRDDGELDRAVGRRRRAVR